MSMGDARDADSPPMEPGRRLDRATIESLVPHKYAMCLWDDVLAWDVERIHLRAHNHRDPDHPLRSGGVLRALHLCEYGAQAMAVHGGVLARASGGTARPGLLVALREVRLQVARIDTLPGAIECEASVLASGETSQQYAFRIHHAGHVLAEGRATAMLR
jgi:predicted hotdog family 3-hydroxylacyl-ACP dehydratase